MASYKVAQDVEADDKLLGPFSFRQFIYLVVATMAGILAYGLSRVFIGLALIPVPIIIFFLAIALPLRKDQPMEIYLAAIVSFYLKPRKRLWQPDGIQSLVEITASEKDGRQLTKDVYGDEAERRLAYLANLADTQGWSIRNAVPPQTNSAMNPDVYNEAQSIPDNFDNNSGVARSFDTMIDQADTARRQALLQQMQGGGVAPAIPSQPAPATQLQSPAVQPQPATTAQPPAAQNTGQPSPDDTANQPVAFNPYPTSMRQHVISPGGQAPATTPSANANQTDQPAPTTDDQTTSEKPVSPDIISLASNKDLTVETIAREAQRIEAKQNESDGEVVISLR